jgi:AmmeMemoRadiSam system protein A/AmmeMemoRadiSam system protein B
MSIIATYLLPHPPLIFPEIGHGEESKISSTIRSYREVAREIVSLDPDTIFIISPHTTSLADYFVLPSGDSAAGDMSEFGAPEVKIHMDYDTEFIDVLTQLCQDEGFPAGTTPMDDKLDHATMIPVRFINDAFGKKFNFVKVGITSLSLDDHYRLGELVAKTSERLGRKVIFIASGDLSHRLLDSGPYGFSPQGPIFDEKIDEVIRGADFSQLFDMTPEFCDQAGECGHRPLVAMAGAIGQRPVSPRLLSHEGPFGVGYAVASFAIIESPPVRLARATVERYIKSGRPPENPAEIAPKLADQHAAAFVSIKKFGELRGCIGTTAPTTDNLATEIIQNAISAATRDPRFSPITIDELPNLSYSVDVLQPPETISSADALDPKTYGVIVRLGGRQGLLLPDLEGVDSVKDQIAIAMEKANIPSSERDKIELQRFTVERCY